MVRELTHPGANEVSRMLEIFRDSFEGEPGFRYMFQNPTTRKDDVLWAAGLKFQLMRKKLKIYVAEPGVSGFSWWVPPGIASSATLCEQLRVGYARAPFRCGAAAFARMYKFASQERILIDRFTAEPIWVLDTIAVDLSQARNGMGGRLLEPGLAAARDSGLGCFVLTHNERNVRFYEKYGFRLEVAEELGASGVTAYCLLYGK